MNNIEKTEQSIIKHVKWCAEAWETGTITISEYKFEISYAEERLQVIEAYYHLEEIMSDIHAMDWQYAYDKKDLVKQAELYCKEFNYSFGEQELNDLIESILNA